MRQVLGFKFIVRTSTTIRFNPADRNPKASESRVGFFLLKKMKYNRNEWIHTEYVKTGTSRHVPLPPQAMKIIEAYQDPGKILV